MFWEYGKNNKYLLHNDSCKRENTAVLRKMLRNDKNVD